MSRAKLFRRPLWNALILAFLFFLASSWLFRARNNFAFFDHPDEASKAEQIITGERNFHHPVLMLEMTETMAKLAGTPMELQAITEMGRDVSGTFAALAVGGLVLLGWRLGGLLTAALSGILAMTHPVLFEVAHYMKEDPSLLVGATLCFVAMEIYDSRPGLPVALVCGATAGLAVSGKYVGISVLVAALLVIALTPGATRPRSHLLVAALLPAVVVFAVVNRDSFFQLHRATSGLHSEIVQIKDPKRLTNGGIRLRYLSVFGTTLSLPVLLAAGYWVGRRWMSKGGQRPAVWVLAAFPVFFIASMSFAPIAKERYLLLAFVLSCVLASAGIVELWRRAESLGNDRWKWRAMAFGLAGAALAWHFSELLPKFEEFQHDSRLEMLAWMQQNLPPDAVIAADDHTQLDVAATSPRFAPQQKVLVDKRYAADFGSFDELRAKGITHVAVCVQDYSGLFKLEKLNKTTEKHLSRRDFYEELFNEGKLLWMVDPGEVKYLHPGLAIYELPKMVKTPTTYVP